MPKFKVGDIVGCTIGGPKMVVCAVHDNSWIGAPINYGCQWFTKQDVLCEALFAEQVLEKRA